MYDLLSYLTETSKMSINLENCLYSVSQNKYLTFSQLKIKRKVWKGE